jgi:hypothetical protein
MKMCNSDQRSPGIFILHAGEKSPIPEVKHLVCKMVSYRPTDRPAMTEVQEVLTKLCSDENDGKIQSDAVVFVKQYITTRRHHFYIFQGSVSLHIETFLIKL